MHVVVLTETFRKKSKAWI